MMANISLNNNKKKKKKVEDLSEILKNQGSNNLS